MPAPGTRAWARTHPPLVGCPPFPCPQGALNADLWLDVYSANALTRTAGGRSMQAAAGAGPVGPGGRGRLVVDVREFMSGLPAVLYKQVRAGG